MSKPKPLPLLCAHGAQLRLGETPAGGCVQWCTRCGAIRFECAEVLARRGEAEAVDWRWSAWRVPLLQRGDARKRK